LKTLLQVLKLSESYLEKHGVPFARLSAEHLLASVLGMDRLGLYLSYDRPLVETELETYRRLLRRRAAHEPLQYILGHTSFRELSVEVGPGVMAPRAETELLVQLVLDHLKRATTKKEAKSSRLIKVLDLCCGSGVIGLSLAHEIQGLWCVLSDISQEALGWAVKNFHRPGVNWSSRVDFLCADLCQAFNEKPFFDVVVANPPYVAPDEMSRLPEEITRWEPLVALQGGGSNGTQVIRRIIESSFRIMAEGALLALEIGETQQNEVLELFVAHQDKYTEPIFHKDLAGKIRFVTTIRR